ncbi:MAG: hypothetical protein ABI557_16255 [Aureliella sp.]
MQTANHIGGHPGIDPHKVVEHASPNDMHVSQHRSASDANDGQRLWTARIKPEAIPARDPGLQPTL